MELVELIELMELTVISAASFGAGLILIFESSKKR
jgi:hypothetical protein